MIYDIIQEIKATSSKNEKIEILKKHEDNELLKKVLVACYSPYVQYYIRKIPDYEPCTRPDAALGLPTPLAEALEVLPALSTREVTGHDARDMLAGLLGDLSPGDAHIIERIIAKTMDAGFSESTVNKVWKKLVPTYPCLLANPYKEKTIAKIVYPAYSQCKADGMRINVHVVGGEVSMCGRSGKPVDILGELDADMLKLAKHIPGDIMFDGELILVENDGSVMARKKGNGKLNKAIRGKMPANEAKAVRIRVWDVITREAFVAEKDTRPYSERFELVKNAVAKANAPKVELIETREVANLAEAEEHFSEMLLSGEEGTILKNKDHVWEDRRSPGLVKMKSEKDCDLEVIGYNPGKGKFEGMVGSIICTSADRLVEVSISGLSDALRKEITDNAASWIGRIVEVRYNERISDKSRSDVDSLFLPRFVELREDKSEANKSAEIL